MEKNEIRLVNKKPKRGLKTNIFSTKTYWRKGLHKVQSRLRIPDFWCELYRQ